MDPVAVKIQAMLPQATNPTAKTNNYTIPSYSNFRHTTIPSFKLDHNLSSKIKLSAYYSYTHTVSPSANGFTQVFTTAQPSDTESQTTRINYDQTISPTMLLHLGVGLLTTNRPPSLRPSTRDSSGRRTRNTTSISFRASAADDIFQGGTSIGLGPALARSS